VKIIESKGTVGLIINLLNATRAMLCCIGINWSHNKIITMFVCVLHYS
jgi:hypothetical protein